MELLQLKYFCDAAVTQNFSATAKKYGVPPSDISQSVRRIEKELGVSLFTRNANSITLNTSGKEFYDMVSVALELINTAVYSLTDDGQSGRLSICINTNRRIVMQALEKFKRQYPDVIIKTRFFCDPFSEDFNIIISNKNPRLKDYDEKKLLCESIMLAVNKDSRYAAMPAVDIAALREESFITMNEQSSLFEITHSICANFGFTPRIAVQGDDPFYIRKCVEFGLGVAFVPAFSWQGQFSENVLLKPIGDYTRNTYIYTDKEKYMPLCAKQFLKMLTEECRI